MSVVSDVRVTSRSDDFGHRKGFAGIVVICTVQIEPIGVHQKKQLESGYQSVFSDFHFWEKFEVGENNHRMFICFQNFPRKLQIFKRNRIYVKEHLSMNRCKNFNSYLEKWLMLAILNVKMSLSTLFRGFPEFSRFSAFVQFQLLKTSSRVLFVFLKKPT